MKIIDKTPLLNEKGELGLSQRLQGILQFGFNWLNELQAQKAIIAYFDRQLEKGYTLIRNLPLGRSGIVVPIILLGPAGVFVIHVAYLRGRYEAHGDAWNVEAGDGYKPAPVNLVQHTKRMARAVKAFIERQGVSVPVDVESVLIGGDPGLHIENVRPSIRVMMIDGVRTFVSNLVTAQPVLSPESVYEFTERLLNPHPPRRTPAASPRPAAAPAPFDEPSPGEVSRARAIFDASQEVKPFDPADFDFAMEEELSFEIDSSNPASVESSPARPLSTLQPRGRRIMGMTPGQVAILAGLVLLFLCIMAGFAYYVLVLS
jgi:hypothetical protein